MRGTWRIRQWHARRREEALLRSALRAVGRFPKVRRKRAHDLDAPLIVTLTSYPPRFPMLAATLRSLLDQTLAADRTILWLAGADVAQLPADVTALTAHGLEIRACDDLRSYKKLIPALAAFPGSYFVTADDDVYYPPKWLESLVAALPDRERAVIGGRVHLAALDDAGMLTPYAGWELATQARAAPSPRQRLFPTGVGGVLYPPGAFAPAVTDAAAFMELCPHGDDIWFFWMARIAGTGQRRARDWFDLVAWPDSQEVGLYAENLHGDRNDRQIRAMEACYGPVP